MQCRSPARPWTAVHCHLSYPHSSAPQADLLISLEQEFSAENGEVVTEHMWKQSQLAEYVEHQYGGDAPRLRADAVERVFRPTAITEEGDGEEAEDEAEAGAEAQVKVEAPTLAERGPTAVWDQAVRPQMLKIIESVVRSCEGGDAVSKACGDCFEVFGFDFMLDSELRVWLIEVNASPAIDTSTAVTEDFVCGADPA